jgi:prepilin-type N-terminal cleavage/methylation domain-containing protein
MSRASARGFSLIESLIALVIVSFGLLAIAGVHLKLTRGEDIARQRGEATRLAQEKLEELRSFTQLNAAAGVNSWGGMAGATDTISNDPNAYHANTTFTRTWQVLDSVDDAWRRVRVTVAWTDRVNATANEETTLSFNTMIAKTDPFDSGALSFPLPGNTTLKRPKNRSLNIPVPATDLGDGHSAIKVTDSLYAVFSNDSGWVVRTCAFEITLASQLNLCPETTAYIIAGYISLSGPSTFPADLAMNTTQITGSTGVTCAAPSVAVDQNDISQTIAGYRYYMCVVHVAAAGNAWSGKVRLAAAALNAGGTNYLVCRFQYKAKVDKPSVDNPNNVQDYTSVTDSLDNQNYLITTANTCPAVGPNGSTFQTTQHQNCRSSNPNSNASNRAADCPATALAL